MALIKSHTTQSGITTDLYYVVTDRSTGFIALSGYASPQAYIDGKPPVDRHTVSYETNPTIEEFVNEDVLDNNDEPTGETRRVATGNMVPNPKYMSKNGDLIANIYEFVKEKQGTGFEDALDA